MPSLDRIKRIFSRSSGSTDREEFIAPEIAPVSIDSLSFFSFLLYFFGLKSRSKLRIEENVGGDNPEIWPEYRSNIVSRLLFSWFTKILFICFYRPLEHKDSWQMDPKDTTNYTASLFRKNWEKDTPSLLKALHHSFGWKLYSAAIPKFIYDILNFVGPVLLGLIIGFLNETREERNIWYGLSLVFILFIAYVLQTLLINIYFHINFRVGMHVRISFFTIFKIFYFLQVSLV